MAQASFNPRSEVVITGMPVSIGSRVSRLSISMRASWSL
jgi:hypothetical protein